MSNQFILNTEFPVKFVSSQALKFSLDEFHQHIANPELLGVDFEDYITEVRKTTRSIETTERPTSLVANYSVPQHNDYGNFCGYAEFVVKIPLLSRKELHLTMNLPIELDPLVAAPWAFDVELTRHPEVSEDEGDPGYYPPDDEELYSYGEMLIKNALENLVSATFEKFPGQRLWMIGDHSWEIPKS